MDTQIQKQAKIELPQNIIKPMINTLADVTGFDTTMNYGRLARAAKKLITASYTAQQVAMAYGRLNGHRSAWYELDWRGKKNQMPTPEDVLTTISGFAGKNVQAEFVIQEHVEREVEEVEELTPELKKIWLPLMAVLKTRMGKAAFGMYVEPTTPISFDGDRLIISTPDVSTSEWLESRAKATMIQILAGVCARPISVEFVV
jgi:hypothetical protein